MSHFHDTYLLRVHPDRLELPVLLVLQIPDALFKPLLTQRLNIYTGSRSQKHPLLSEKIDF